MAKAILMGAVLLGCCVPAYADDSQSPRDSHDFYIVYKSCKMLAASSTRPEKGLHAIDDNESAPGWGCQSRGNRRILCDTVLDEGHGQPTLEKTEFVVDFDGSDVFAIHSNNYTHWGWIDRVNHTATLITRLLPEQRGEIAIATRLCQGIYMTTDEAKAMRKSSKSTK